MIIGTSKFIWDMGGLLMISWHRSSDNGTGDVMLGYQVLDTQEAEKLGVPEYYIYQVLEGHYYLISNWSSYRSTDTSSYASSICSSRSGLRVGDALKFSSYDFLHALTPEAWM